MVSCAFCSTVYADLVVGDGGAAEDIVFGEDTTVVEPGQPDYGGGTTGSGFGGGGGGASGSSGDVTISESDNVTEETEMSFTDVKKENWFYNDVLFVYNRKIMTGTGKGTFSPNTTLNRAMMITVLYRLDGEKETSGENTFTDVVKDSWYEAAATWGYENKVVSGVGNSKFSPMGNLTREQLCVMLYNYTKHLGKNTNKAELTSFTDYKSVSSWATDAVAWAVDAGIVTGKGNGTLAPGDSATRAEMAACIRRYMEKIVESEGE